MYIINDFYYDFKKNASDNITKRGRNNWYNVSKFNETNLLFFIQDVDTGITEEIDTLQFLKLYRENELFGVVRGGIDIEYIAILNYTLLEYQLVQTLHLVNINLKRYDALANQFGIVIRDHGERYCNIASWLVSHQKSFQIDGSCIRYRYLNSKDSAVFIFYINDLDKYNSILTKMRFLSD